MPKTGDGYSHKRDLYYIEHMQPDYWKKAQTHLRKSCPTMGKIIAHYKGETLTARGDGFFTLARSVVGQQISVKAADAIWARFAALAKPLTPETVMKLEDQELRNIGFSGSKVAYVKNIARFFVESQMPEHWNNHSDEEVVAALTTIKGVGSWTAEMFMIFHLMRPDVLPLKDIGLLKGIDLHYTGGKRLTNAEYLKIAEPWAPYRSVATWYLWRSLDPVPVEY